jgi:hypothetical protein
MCLGFLGLFLPGPTSLPAQAPIPDRAGRVTELPRFTLREIVAGRNDTPARVPGRWLRAALASMPESLATAAYRTAATRSGLEPLQGNLLASERAWHVMGLYRRAELARAAKGTLEAIRDSLRSDTARVRFDHLFRPEGEWVVDIHDAALAWARARAPGLTWEAARRSLTATRWLSRGGSSASEAVPRALYGLTLLAATDSVAFVAARSDLLSADSASGAAAHLLLAGYEESRKWYVDALRFFLTQPWIPDAGRGHSLADQVGDYWRRGPAAQGAVEVPEIRTRLFGHPQAVPHYGVPSPLFRRLVRTDNSSADVWLERHGEAGLLRTLRRLPAGDTGLVLLETGSEAIRLTTVPRHSRESLNGFLEPGDAIVIDPGYAPLLALGAVVHEWQHLRFRRLQLESFTSRLPQRPGAIVELPGVEPYIAEGFAEWSTEQILTPVVERWPLLSLGELQKRAGLARGMAEDQHAMGYALVQVLAAEVGDPAVTTDLLLRHAEHPSRIANIPAVRRAWRKHGAASDRLLTIPAHRILIPEVTFTIEDGFPEVIATRILIPPSGRGSP